jgi:hypothetical protein
LICCTEKLRPRGVFPLPSDGDLAEEIERGAKLPAPFGERVDNARHGMGLQATVDPKPGAKPS